LHLFRTLDFDRLQPPGYLATLEENTKLQASRIVVQIACVELRSSVLLAR
jgi:hypothetical protein